MIMTDLVIVELKRNWRWIESGETRTFDLTASSYRETSVVGAFASLLEIFGGGWRSTFGVAQRVRGWIL
jgi:hypothetical protein